jgi:hypothetical protein
MSKILSSFALSICLLIPVSGVAFAKDHPHPHQWAENENPTWHQWLKENHRKDHEWAKANKREQAAYWKWRDQHRDAH